MKVSLGDDQRLSCCRRMKLEALPRTLRNCRTSYSDETGIAVAAFSNRRVGNAQNAGLASGPGSLVAPNLRSVIWGHTGGGGRYSVMAFGKAHGLLKLVCSR